jgi:fused signal recognition particle receptor
MFKFLKEKIQSWTKGLAKKAEEKEKPEEKQKVKKVFKVKLEEEKQKEKRGFFQKIGEKLSTIKISEREFDVYQEELEMLLLENNVALEVAEKIIQDLKEKIVGKEFLKKEAEAEIKEAFKEIIREILVTPPNLVEQIKEKNSDQSREPYVILFCGINGSGKTTTIAKIAENLKSRGISCVMAAGDTFRAASIEQLKEHGNKIGIKVISHEYGDDPASVGFDAIQYAKKNFINCVLIDTAGRMHTQKNLLREMEKIVKVCKPDKKIFVGESITGNDAIEQVRSFDWAIGIDGIVLTKADIDEKGGTSLSVGYVTKKPILYLGTGQAYDKIEVFDKEKFIKRLGL